VYQLTRNVSIVKVEHNLHVSRAGIVTAEVDSTYFCKQELDRVQLEIAKSVNLRKDSHAATIIIEQPPSPSHQRPQQQTKVIDVH
jgi:hypothetical protein